MNRRQDTPEDPFADARQVQTIAERIWADEHPGERFPSLGDDRLRDLYDRAKALADG